MIKTHLERDFFAFVLNNTPRNAYNRGVRRNFPKDHRIGAYVAVIPYLYVAQHLGAGADYNVIAKRRVALSCLFTCPAERHALKERYIIAYFCSLPYNHTHAVVNEETFADNGAGMYLYAGQEPSGL